MRIHDFPGNGELTLVVVAPPDSTPDQGGEVAIELKSGELIPVPLDDRLFRVLRILIEAASIERELNMRAKGVRSAVSIARLYADQAGEIATAQPEAIKHYVFLIRKAVNGVIAALEDEGRITRAPIHPKVIATIPRRGYCVGDMSIMFYDYTSNA
jgi:hypothetical protein